MRKNVYFLILYYALKCWFFFRCRGGRNEAYSLFCESDNNSDIIYLDIVSSYPFEAMSNKFPKGSYQILIGPELDNITYKTEEESYYYKGNQYFILGEINVKRNFIISDEPLCGLVHVEVIPPGDLALPYLPIRLSDGVVYALCKSCAEKRKKGFCTCTDK